MRRRRRSGRAAAGGEKREGLEGDATGEIYCGSGRHGAAMARTNQKQEGESVEDETAGWQEGRR